MGNCSSSFFRRQPVFPILDSTEVLDSLRERAEEKGWRLRPDSLDLDCLAKMNAYEKNINAIALTDFNLTPREAEKFITSLKQKRRLLRDQLAEKTAAHQAVGRESASKETKSVMHHTQQHALDVMTRVMTTEKKMSLIDNLTPNPEFRTVLKAITAFIVEFHDLEQFAKEGTTNEIATATCVVGRLLEAISEMGLEVSRHEQWCNVIRYMTHAYIVLGTSMRDGKAGIVDLSQIYIELATQRDHAIIQHVRQMMVLIGVCDKFPAAFRCVAEAQYKDKALNALNVVRIGLNEEAGSTQLEAFFCEKDEAMRFHSYYEVEEAPNETDQQAFLMTIVSNLGVCIEQETGPQRPKESEEIADRRRESALLLLDFVESMRGVLSEEERREPFFERYRQVFRVAKDTLTPAFETVFINNIKGERQFALELCSSLIFGQASLVDFEKRDALIFPDAPKQHALNLEAFKKFYESLSVDRKTKLIQEVMLLLIRQPGEILLSAIKAEEAVLGASVRSDRRSRVSRAFSL